MTVDYFIYELKEPSRAIVDYLHHLVIHLSPEIKPTIKWNIPFYTLHADILYVNPKQKKIAEIEICFIRARYYENGSELLDFKNRKVVGSLTFSKLEDINEEHLVLLIKEAISADQRLRGKTPWK